MVEQIALSTHEQSHGSELINSSVERMRNITRELMHAISINQNSATQVIKANSESSGIVVQISEASILQAGNSQQIGESLSNFEESTKLHVTSTIVMDEVLEKLARQIDVLQKEMERFKVQA